MKSGIPIDNLRKNFINSVMELDLGYMNGEIMSLDSYQVSMFISDSLLLYNNAVVSYYKSAFNSLDDVDLYKKLFAMAPNVLFDSIDSFALELDKKKRMFYNLVEILVKKCETKTFADGHAPIPVGHKLVIFDYFKKNYKSSTFDAIIREFHELEGITRDESYLKALMVEMFISTIISKGDNGIPNSQAEEKLVEYFGYVNNASLSSISKFYDSKNKGLIQN